MRFATLQPEECGKVSRGLAGLTAMLLALLLGACATRLFPADPAHAALTRVMTFNIRLDTASDDANAWPYRRTMVIDLIRHEAPDVLGMQEVLVGQKRALEEALPEYAVLGVGRDDGREGGEFSPVAFRRDRFELLESGTFWLSATPQTPAAGWDAALPRVATWAILRDRRAGETIRVLNTHFDHVGQLARANSARQIVRWVENGPGAGLPTIVMGDFNAAPGSEPYRILNNPNASSLVDSGVVSRSPRYGPQGTFTGFNITHDASEPIDHIFVTSELTVDSHQVITQHWGGRLPSDHYPVQAVLRLRGDGEPVRSR